MSEDDLPDGKPHIYHVYPSNDLKDHITLGTSCWCKPRIEEDGRLIVHNSMDERESYEAGRKPS